MKKETARKGDYILCPKNALFLSNCNTCCDTGIELIEEIKKASDLAKLGRKTNYGLHKIMCGRCSKCTCEFD